MSGKRKLPKLVEPVYATPRSRPLHLFILSLLLARLTRMLSNLFSGFSETRTVLNEMKIVYFHTTLRLRKLLRHTVESKFLDFSFTWQFSRFTSCGGTHFVWKTAVQSLMSLDLGSFETFEPMQAKSSFSMIHWFMTTKSLVHSWDYKMSFRL